MTAASAPPRAVAIVLARAGSKGVPGKNRALVGGRPCAAWTIEHAQRSSLVHAVALSTDDPHLREIALSMGAIALERPPALASDQARVDDAARDAIARLDRCGVISPDPKLPVVILYANVPVRPADLTDRAIRLLLGTNADSVQSFAPAGKHHPWWTARVDPSTGALAGFDGGPLFHNVFRRQDLPPAFIPDGGVLVVTREALELRVPDVAPGPHAFMGRDRRGVITGEGDVVDIDAPIDLAVADALLSARAAHRAHAEHPAVERAR